MAAALAAHQLPLRRLHRTFTAFMLDVHNQLGILSKGYQSNTLVIFDISKNLNRTLRALDKLKKEESCGPEESKFWGFVNTDDADCLLCLRTRHVPARGR